MTPDVAIVGAGVVGCSLAFHLAQRGASVVVFDKGGVASGMTARSGALVRMHYTFAPEADLAWKSLRYFQNWREIVGGECGFVTTGFAIVVDSSNADRLRANVAMLQELGIDTRILNPQQLAEFEPEANVSDVALSTYEPQSGYADPTATTLSLAKAAETLGAEFRLNTSIDAIVVGKSCATGVRMPSGTMAAGAVCVVAGPWTDTLLAPHGVTIGLRCERAQIAYFDRAPSRRHGGFIDTIAGSYFRPHGANLTLAGLGAWKTEPPVDPDRFKESNDQDFIAAVRERLVRRIPRLAGAIYWRGHAGVYDVSPDARAVIGPVPGTERLYVAAGFSGTGFKTAPAVGGALAELILDGRSTIADLGAFNFERIASGKLIQPPNEYTMASFGHRI